MKELWVYANTGTFPEVDLDLLKAQFPTLTIRRASIDTAFWWKSIDITGSYWEPHKSGTGFTFTPELRDGYFIPDITDWTAGMDPTVDFGILEASFTGDLGAGIVGDVHISYAEPGIKFLMKTDGTYSDAVKQNFLEGYAAIREATRAWRPDFIEVAVYNTILGTSGRRSPVENGDANKMVGWAFDQGLTGLDDTPLFNELSWYPSGRLWSDIYADMEENIAFAIQHSNLDPATHLTAVLYSDNRMLDPNDPRIAGTAAEGATGGIESFKAWARTVAHFCPPDKKLVAITRRYTTSGTMSPDFGEIPHSEEWFKAMAQFFAESQDYDVVAHYASGGSPDANLGNGTTFRQQLQWLAEAMVGASQNFLVTTPTVVSSSSISDPRAISPETVIAPMRLLGPNWSNAVKISTTFKTAQSVNANNNKVRRLLASRPQRGISYEFLETGWDENPRRRHDILLAGLARGLEALWPDIVPCEDVGGSDFAAYVKTGFDPTKHRYFVGQKVLVGSLSDKTKVIERTITAVSSSAIQFTPAAGMSIPNAVAVPCMLCDVVQTSAFRAITARTSSGTLNRTEVVGASALPARIVPGANPPGFPIVDDLPAYLPKHNFAEDLRISVSRGYVSTDIGIDQHRNYVGKIPLLSYSMQFSSDDRDAINEIAGLFESRGGSVYPFWFLDPLDDLQVFAAEDAGAAVGPSVNFNNDDVANGLEEIDFLLRPHIYIIDISGNTYIREIASAGANADSWILNFTEGGLPSLNSSSIARSGFAVLAHFSDSMTEEWPRTGVGTLSLEINQSEGQPNLDIANFPLLAATDLDVRWTVSYCDPPTCEELGGLPVAPDCCFLQADRLRVSSKRIVNDSSDGSRQEWEIPETILDPLVGDSNYPAGKWSWEGTVQTVISEYNSSNALVSQSSTPKQLRISCETAAASWTINFVGSNASEIKNFLYCDGPAFPSSSTETLSFGSLCDQFSDINCQSYDNSFGTKSCSGNVSCAGITYSEEFDDPILAEATGTWSTLILRTL